MSQYLRRVPKWRVGLTHIWCTGCGRDLDWAQPEFLARYPDPLCAACPPREPVLVRPVITEATTVRAEAEVISVVPNARFESVVASIEAGER